MENILLPSKMTFQDGDIAHEQIMTIEPLHHGYGTTIGNALRRVMLSSLEGSAVTDVKIKGVQHEFSPVTGVKEDALEIIMNLKALRLKVHSDESVNLSLSITGKEGVIKASDIEANADVEMIDPDAVICTMTDKSVTLDMNLVVARGRGFMPTEKRDDTGGEIGMMAIDAIFSPVLNVGLTVENTRVGEITNYDKLIMQITTDGSITPQEAVAQATKVIMNHFNWVENQFAHSSIMEAAMQNNEASSEAKDVETPVETSEETPEDDE
ncbi:DNA-directed RNA polymerase subunit alpha [Candidatus Uhrbacteria bacterium]|nr:DNA-directed RNA polymerase subunit alpha [Candidatus Uhrbacteria bacterium]